MDERVRTTATLLTVLFVALAGCVGGADDARRSGVSPTDASADTATGAPTDRSHPLAESPLGEGHAATLRAAGSFAVRTNVTLRGSATNDTRFRNTTTMVDVSNGTLLTRTERDPSLSETTYAAADGERYQRVRHSEGAAPEYRSQTAGYDVEGYVESAPAWFEAAYDYEYAGPAPDDGSVHVYTVTSVEQLTNRSATVTRYDPRNVTDIHIRVEVTDDGLVRNLSYRLEREAEGERVTLTMRTTYTGLGTTVVQPPSWLGEAKEEVQAGTTVPDRAREVTETVRDESLGAAATVTGPEYAVEHVEFERPTRWPFDDDSGGFREAQVSAAVTVRSYRDVEFERLELAYNESAIPDANASEYDVYRYNETLQTFVPVGSDIDGEANVASVELDREGTYLVMHTPTWRDGWE